MSALYEVLVLPLAVATVLLDRAQAHLTTGATTTPTAHPATPEPVDRHGGESQ